jgi:hypothetical protein
MHQIKPQLIDGIKEYYYHYYKGQYYYVYGDDPGPSEPEKLVLPVNDPNVYYEWNARIDRWDKFNDDDPDPPEGMRPGTHDGEIYSPHATA